jgi:hypothetical protein
MTDRNLNDWIDGYMKFTENTEPPDSFKLWCAISTIAAALQRKCVLEWGTIKFYPNMYIVLVGPSGCRKGTAMGIAMGFLEHIGVKLAAEATTREALIRELKNANANDVSTDPGKISFHSSLTIFAQELTVFLGYNNLALLSDLTDWYDCRNKWTYRTKNMGSDEIIGVFVNLIGATTPDLIRSTMPLDAIGGGLTSRMVFVNEFKKGKTVVAPFLTDAEWGLWELLKRDLEHIHLLSGKFKMTDPFFRIWSEWYPYQDQNPPFRDSRFNGYLERRPNHIMKLSMIVNASRTNSMILDECDILRAIQILETTEKNMLQVFSGVGKYRHAESLTAIMNEIGLRGEEGISQEELMRIFARDINLDNLKEIIQILDTMNYIDVINRPGIGEFYKHRGVDACISKEVL